MEFVVFLVIFNDNVMAANAFVFFAAGFETTAATLAYCLLELAANLNLQNKMRQEILNAINQNDGKLTYDVAKNLEYVEKVLSGKDIYLYKETFLNLKHFLNNVYHVNYQCNKQDF